MAKAAVLGHGVVGSGVVEVMQKNKAVIEKKAGQSMEVKRILDLREFPGLPYSDKFTKDFQDILNDDEKLLLEISKRFAKHAKDTMSFDVENGTVQDFQNLIEKIIECCEENDWFEKQ